MESEGDEASLQNPKWSKPRRHRQLPLTSMQDSSLILPQELITEILLRVPVKSLLQFRCVSKSWLSLISGPEFIKTHLSLSTNNKDQAHHMLMMGFNRDDFNHKDCSFSSLFCNFVTKASSLSYPMKLREESYWSVGSVNGLICLVHGKKDLFLWNPSIRRYKKLRDPRPQWRYDDYLYGFGYDEFQDDYKVVGIFGIYGGSPRVDIKMYSVKSDSWRKIHYCQDGMIFSRSAWFLNGKLHWTTRTGPEDMSSNIICFNLADENWGKVEWPCNGDFGSLGVLGNYLSIFDHVIANSVDVWVMKEYGVKESWTNMFTINYPVDDLPIYFFVPSVFLSNSGKILVAHGSTFMIYHPADDSFRFMEVINVDRWWTKAQIYLETLVFPFATEGNGEEPKTKPKQKLKNLRSSKSSNQ